jgi:hypothetical protein
MQTMTTTTSPNGQVLQTATTVAPNPASSVEITQNAKGQAQVSVKLYGENPDDIADQALALYRRLVGQLQQA